MLPTKASGANTALQDA
ncbi:hypothetical protein [Crossiella equi]|nr:hypothetical protein [Crossiella equi]